MQEVFCFDDGRLAVMLPPEAASPRASTAELVFETASLLRALTRPILLPDGQSTDDACFNDIEAKARLEHVADYLETRMVAQQPKPTEAKTVAKAAARMSARRSGAADVQPRAFDPVFTVAGTRRKIAHRGFRFVADRDVEIKSLLDVQVRKLIAEPKLSFAKAHKDLTRAVEKKIAAGVIPANALPPVPITLSRHVAKLGGPPRAHRPGQMRTVR